MFQVITGDSWPLSTNHRGKSGEKIENLLKAITFKAAKLSVIGEKV